MGKQADLIVICISVGVAIGLLLAVCTFFGLRWYKKRSHLRQRSTGSNSVTSLPIRTNGVGASIDSSTSISTSTSVNNSHVPAAITPRSWWNHHNKDPFASKSGIPRYSYKYVLFYYFHMLILPA